MQSLEEFYVDLFQSIVTRSSVERVLKEEALFEIIRDELIDIGEFEDAYYAHYRPMTGGLQVDGYCGDPLEDTVAREANAGSLGLIALDFSGNSELETITQTTLNAITKRVLNFITKARDVSFRKGLEETDSGYEVAELIAKRWSILTRIKIYVFTDKKLSSRAKGIESTEVEGKPVVFELWDATRLYRLTLSGRERENLEIDFNLLPHGPLRALRAGSGRDIGDVYLAAMPGLDLAAIYDRWGTRLLEQNVRVFLQARSNVNKGIKSTLENSPDLFFSFNNGLTTTAERVETIETEEGTKIVRLENLQIVNGGQTTASIYAAYRNGVDLSKVYVQMKLNVVSPSKATELVPQISRSANSQNRVSDADFFSNHPYHVRIEEFSRRLWAPPAEGTFAQTKWYYERARGQYRDDQSHMTATERKQFVADYPKAQVFTKTDLAKYLMVWTDQAYLVNRGAQKNFAVFAKLISTDWEKDDTQFSEYYFRCLVAKKIIFNATERIVSQRKWYEAGMYRSQHVVLTIGLLAHAVAKMGKAIDFESVWQAQSISPAFEVALGLASDVAHRVLMHPQEGSHNISEWAKQPNCWTVLIKQQVTWNEDWIAELLDKSAEQEAKAVAKKDQKELNAIEAQKQVIAMGGEFWTNVLKWATGNHEVTDKEIGYLKAATRISAGHIPQDWQCVELVGLMKRLGTAGCPYRIRLGQAGRARRRR